MKSFYESDAKITHRTLRRAAEDEPLPPMATDEDKTCMAALLQLSVGRRSPALCGVVALHREQLDADSRTATEAARLTGTARKTCGCDACALVVKLRSRELSREQPDAEDHGSAKHGDV